MLINVELTSELLESSSVTKFLFFKSVHAESSSRLYSQGGESSGAESGPGLKQGKSEESGNVLANAYAD